MDHVQRFSATQLPLPLLVDAGQRYDTQTTWEADETMYLEDQATINNASYCGALNCVMGLNRWQQADNYLTYPYALMWRSSNPNTGSGFTSYPPESVDIDCLGKHELATIVSSRGLLPRHEGIE